MASYKGKYLAAQVRRRIPMRYIVLVMCLLTLLSTSAVLAKYVTNSGQKENRFSMVQVSCQAQEVFQKNEKTSITVKNTSSIDVYIRVRLVSYWETPSGHIAGKTSAVPDFTPGDGWIAGGNDTYYYKYKVSSETAGGANVTENLLAENTVLKLADPTDAGVDGYIQVVKVLAEAIQADGMTEDGIPAVKDAWGVSLENGEIQIP